MSVFIAVATSLITVTSLCPHTEREREKNIYIFTLDKTFGESLFCLGFLVLANLQLVEFDSIDVSPVPWEISEESLPDSLDVLPALTLLSPT